jgi:hypothetical protein
VAGSLDPVQLLGALRVSERLESGTRWPRSTGYTRPLPPTFVVP